MQTVPLKGGSTSGQIKQQQQSQLLTMEITKVG